MSFFLPMAVLVPVAVVVLAVFLVLWRERKSKHEARIAVTTGSVLALWAVIDTVLARQGSFELAPGETVPPVGINLVVVLLALVFCLAVSPSLRTLLSRQSSLIRLHLWRFEGILFLVLMAQGRLPALFALPAGIGDISIAATAPWVASNADTPQGRHRAIIWNWLGMTDLVVAIGLGVTTNPGAAHVFNTIPTSEVITRFPMALIPTLLVPLAMTLHGVSLLQLIGGKWSRPSLNKRMN